MTDDQSELLASPSWYTDLEQPQEVLEELAVQLDLLTTCCFTLAWTCACLTLSFASYRGRFLLGDCIADTIDEGDKEGKVYGARDACAVLKIEGCELVDERLDRSAR